MEIESIYPLSKDKAMQILKRDNLSDSTKDYLMSVLNDMRENYYMNRIQYFQGLSDFVTEGYYKGAKYSDLIKLNQSTCGNEKKILARANSISGLRTLLSVIVLEQLLDDQNVNVVTKFIAYDWNAFKGSKGEYLTTKEEIKYMHDTMNLVFNVLQERISTKKVSQ